MSKWLYLILIAAVSAIASSGFVFASEGSGHPQVIKLQRFRKALWTIHLTIKGK